MDPISILWAALGIGCLIFVHELGHYLAARVAGVRVEVFSLGFGQRLVGFVRNGTDYRLSLFPLGGYVRVAGEDPTQREGLADDDLYAKGFGARALFFSGGVFMNLLFALVAFPLVFRSGVEFTAPVVGTVQRGGAAWGAGIEPGDRILSVAGKPMYSFENLEVEVALAGGKGQVAVEVERGERRFSLDLRPRYSEARGLFELGMEPAAAREPVMVEEVLPDSTAAKAGLEPRDRIVSIDGRRLVGDEANRALVSVDEGARLELVVDRAGTELPIAFDIGKLPIDAPRIGVLSATPRVIAVRDVPAVTALGIQAGDVLLRVDGAPFAAADPAPLRDGKAPTLRVEVRRGGEELALRAPLDAAGRAQLVDGIALGPVDGQVVVVPVDDSPATRAGLLPGDVLLAADGRDLRAWTDLVTAVRGAGTKSMKFLVARGDRRLDVEVVPERTELASLGFVGSLDRQRDLYRVDAIGPAVKAGFVASIDLVKQLYVTLKRLFTGDVSARNLGGIVTISRVSYRAAQSGLAFFFYFLALLSINLAFINVLPIPVLDGGHLMFLLIEKIKGSPVSARVMNYSQILGLVFVIALMVFVTYNDILRLL